MKTTYRRSLAVFSAAAVLVSGLAGGLMTNEARGDRTFTMAASGGSWGKVLTDSLLAPFGEKHSVTVRHDVKGNVQRLLAMVANPQASGIDVVEISGSRIALAVGNKVLEKLDTSKIPNYAHIPSIYKNDYWAGTVVCPLSIVYNPKHVTEEEASSWDVLANPKFKGRVGIPEYTWQGENWLHAVNLHKGGTYANMTPGISFASSVMKNGGTLIQSPDHGLKQFAAGNIWVAAFLTGRALSPAGQAVPLKFKLVDGWWPLSPGFGIVKGSPNADIAADFINRSLTPEHELAISKLAGCVPTNSTAQLTDDLKQLAISPENVKKAVALDYAEMFKVGAGVLERWNREVLP